MAELPKREMKVTAQDLADAQVPIHLRDYCAHLVIPFLKCQRDNYFLPWKCKAERHAWDTCQMDDHYRRIKEKERLKMIKEKTLGEEK